MPLLLTTPLKTTALLDIPSVYVIIDVLTFNRKLRRANFTVGYYAYEAASLPETGAAQVEVNLPTGFSLVMTPAQAAQVGDPVELLEEYTQHTLLELLPGATIESVA